MIWWFCLYHTDEIALVTWGENKKKMHFLKYQDIIPLAHRAAIEAHPSSIQVFLFKPFFSLNLWNSFSIGLLETFSVDTDTVHVFL